MEILSNVSADTYRRLVNDNPQFIEYFIQVTPIRELDRITIGSRPARRRNDNRIESLRAIPWVFAWTQNRLILPAWYGVGESLQAASQKWGMETFVSLQNEWTYFSSMLGMVEMVLSKTNIPISETYEKHLASKSLWDLGEELRNSFYKTKQTVLDVFNESELLATNPILERSIEVRSPCLLVLHILQIVLLERRRRQKNENNDYPENTNGTSKNIDEKNNGDSTVQDAKDVNIELLERALQISIAGIAAGMNNTG